MVMPWGASPIEAFISCRLNEPLRREPQIATTFVIACPVQLVGKSSPAGRECPRADGGFLARLRREWRAWKGAPRAHCRRPRRRAIQSPGTSLHVRRLLDARLRGHDSRSVWIRPAPHIFL